MTALSTVQSRHQNPAGPVHCICVKLPKSQFYLTDIVLQFNNALKKGHHHLQWAKIGGQGPNLRMSGGPGARFIKNLRKNPKFIIGFS